MPNNHKIIAFEGLDCSFKETNFKTFVNALHNVRDEEGFVIHTESFPRYGYWAAKPAECWLNGHYDRNILQHYPIAKCALYNVDRMDYWLAKHENGITNLDLLNSNDKFHYFIFDRYILSNTIYNPIHPNEIHIEDIVYNTDEFSIPRPNVIVWMRMKNFDVLAKQLAAKQNKDMNELDLDYLRNVWERSEQIINSDIFNKTNIKLIVVDCLYENDKIRPREELADYIWKSGIASPV